MKILKNLKLNEISKFFERISLYCLFSNAALFSMKAPFATIMFICIIVFILSDIVLLINFFKEKGNNKDVK